jgi:hypothetical protein
MLDIILCILLFITGNNLKNWVRGFNTYDKKILTWLWLWHIVAGIAYVFYTIASGGGDAYGYWSIPKDEGWGIIESSIGTGSPSGYMFLINYFPSKVLDISFFTGSMLYVLLGYAGLIFLYKIIKENIPNYLLLKKVKVLQIPIFPIFLFLPGINFWTSGLGKDTILFFSIVIFIYAIKNIKQRFGYIILSVLLSIFMRPHILLFLLTAYGGSVVFDTRIKLYNKIFLYAIFIAVFFVFLPYVMNFAHLENLDTSTIENYANHKAGALASKEGTGSAIDISNYPYPLKVFSFLFRPMFVDMPSAFGVAASFENLIFMIFLIKVFSKKILSGFSQGPVTIKTSLFFFIIGSLIFPLILGNLGTILREKTPFIVAFIIFGYWSIINYYIVKINKQKRYAESEYNYQIAPTSKKI